MDDFKVPDSVFEPINPENEKPIMTNYEKHKIEIIATLLSTHENRCSKNIVCYQEHLDPCITNISEWLKSEATENNYEAK